MLPDLPPTIVVGSPRPSIPTEYDGLGSLPRIDPQYSKSSANLLDVHNSPNKGKRPPNVAYPLSKFAKLPA